MGATWIRDRARGSLLRVMVAVALPVAAAAQTPAAPAQPPPTTATAQPNDTPSIRIGVTVFGDYTVQTEPKGTDVDGNEFTPSQFNIQRAYLNVTGQINHIVAFRVTPDIARETGAGSSLSGSYTYRLKYAYAQFNLDDWMSRGSYARFGMQPTIWVGFIDDVYRYRFQGPTLEDREGILSSSDFGATFRYTLGGNYGDVHTGFYNGDNYNRVEANDQKAFMIRGTLRPLPEHSVLRGLRITGFTDLDAYVKDAERRRSTLAATFEHTYVNAAFNYLWTTDQTRAAAPEVDGRAWSFWATPKTNASSTGFEGLIRYDRITPDTSAEAVRGRVIAGVAYWFPHVGNVTTALMFDVENVDNDNFAAARPDERRYAVRMLINY
jgi:hypothetical protein